MDEMNPAPPYLPPVQYPFYSPVNAIAGPAKVFGILYAVLAVLSLLGAISLVALSGAASQRNLQPPGGVGLGVGRFFLSIAALVLAVAVLYAATAYGVLARTGWGRTLMIVTSIVSLFSVPVGTILGACALYFFLRQGAREDYDRLTLGQT